MSEKLLPAPSGLLFDDLEKVCVLDGHEPGQAELIREIAAEWDTEVCGLALSFAALKARETVNVN